MLAKAMVVFAEGMLFTSMLVFVVPVYVPGAIHTMIRGVDGEEVERVRARAVAVVREAQGSCHVDPQLLVFGVIYEPFTYRLRNGLLLPGVNAVNDAVVAWTWILTRVAMVMASRRRSNEERRCTVVVRVCDAHNKHNDCDMSHLCIKITLFFHINRTITLCTTININE